MSFILFNKITILEPYVLISDVILSIACFYCYLKIKSKTEDVSHDDFSKYWRRFFLFEAISFLIGGLAHGLYSYFGDALHFVGWYASVIGVFYFTWGMMKFSLENMNKNMTYFLLMAMIVCSVISTVLKDFNVIIGYCFLLMFIVIILNSKSKVISFKNIYSKGILVGTLLFILSAFIHIFEVEVFKLAKQIVSHLVLTIGILFFGNGCLKTIVALRDKQKKIG